ncbi:MAG: DUF2812 domain-containing protein [Dethiobacteria bacterium]|jgi:hypothetical protein|nr:DUF2812 domain-containing protein [Bacillota bacterium]
MGKLTKRTLFMFSLLDYKAMEEYFEQMQMAAQGWMLEKIEVITAKFRKSEPQKLKFSVDIFPYISAFDSHESKSVTEYRELCEASGWRFVTSSNKFQVFYAKTDEDPIPIQTDSVVEEKILRKSIFSSEFLLFLTFFLIFFLSLGSLFPFDYSKLFTNSGIVSTISNPLLILPVALYTGYYLLWFWKAKKNIKRGLSLPQTSLRAAQLRGNLLVFFTALFIFLYLTAIIADALGGYTFALYFLIIPLSGVAVGLWFRNIVLNKVRSRTKNILIFAGAILAITIIFTSFTTSLIISRGTLFEGIIGMKNELPDGYAASKLEDFGLKEEPHNTAFMRNSSFIVPTNYEYHEISTEGVIRTRYYEAINAAIAAYIFDGMLEREGSLLYRSVSAAPAEEWNVDRGYYLKDDSSMLLLLKDKLVILLDSEFDFSLPETIDAAKSGLDISD